MEAMVVQGRGQLVADSPQDLALLVDQDQEGSRALAIAEEPAGMTEGLEGHRVLDRLI